MIKIPLTQGKHAIVDDIDVDLSHFNWCVKKDGSRKKRSYKKFWYAARTKHNTIASSTTIRMHRMILERTLGRELNRNEITDHINHNGLDNRRSNLRLATRKENNFNRYPRGTKTSQYKGVHRKSDTSKWIAQIQDGKQIYLGSYTNEEDAARAYDKAAIKIHSTFAVLNFPNETNDLRVKQKKRYQERMK